MSHNIKPGTNLYQKVIKQLIRISMIFYGCAIIMYGIQQFIYGNFRNVQLPPWQFQIPGLSILAYLAGIGLIVAGLAITFEVKSREAALILGAIFLALCCFVHVPYELISEPNKSYHLGLWESALKELALAGGAFVVAESFPEIQAHTPQKNSIIKFLDKISPFGSIFFSLTMTSFGIAHFMYIKYIVAMVPGWVPDHTFWVYFTGTALIGAGICVILDIRKRTIAALLGIMIFFWFMTIHIPDIANSAGDKRNQIASAFDALAFSSTAFLIAFGARMQKDKDLI